MRSGHLGVVAAVSFALLAATNASAAEGTLDYDYYKRRVEPIFLKKRPDHARCATCHVDSTSAFKLEKPSGKNAAWADAESRKNFAVLSALVTPGNPDTSHLLMYPLSPVAGGTTYHSGGRQFASKNDPDWKTMAAWVNGAKIKATVEKK